MPLKDFLPIFFVAISLAMDAFAVSVTNGSCVKNIRFKHCLTFAFYFGTFQFVMTICGYILGTSFAKYVFAFDHWVAFILLSIIGGKMIFDSFAKDDILCNNESEIMSATNLIPLAVATSIDALAVGVTYATVNVNIVIASITIGIVAFILSGVGVFVGKRIGGLFKANAERFGGIILILIGINILVEHLGLLQLLQVPKI